MTDEQFLSQRKSIDDSYIAKLGNLKKKFLKTASPYVVGQVIECDIKGGNFHEGLIHNRFLISGIRVLTVQNDYTNLNIVFDGHFLGEDNMKIIKFTVSYSKNKQYIKLSSNQKYKNNVNIN